MKCVRAKGSYKLGKEEGQNNFPGTRARATVFSTIWSETCETCLPENCSVLWASAHMALPIRKVSALRSHLITHCRPHRAKSSKWRCFARGQASERTLVCIEHMMRIRSPHELLDVVVKYPMIYRAFIDSGCDLYDLWADLYVGVLQPFGSYHRYIFIDSVAQRWHRILIVSTMVWWLLSIYQLATQQHASRKHFRLKN